MSALNAQMDQLCLVNVDVGAGGELGNKPGGN